MKPWKMCAAASVGALAAVLGLTAAGEKSSHKTAAGLVLVDAKGKEQKVKAWQFVAGTRRLGWLAPQKKEPERPEKRDRGGPPARPRPADRHEAQGPEALAFRDDNSTVWKDGVLTLVPLEHLRGIDFDNENETATVRVATGDKPDADATLTGTTKYRGTNKFTIEAEVDKGELGIAAVKFNGGVKNGIRSLRLPSPKPAPAPAGRPAQVTVNLDGKKKAAEKVTDLSVLYETPAGEKLAPVLLFKKTIKLDLSKARKLVAAEGEVAEWQVTLKDGNEETFTLRPAGELDGVQVVFQGFLARVPAGYKLFPAHAVAEIEFESKAEEKP